MDRLFFLGAAAGLSGLLRGYRKPGPAGLRGLLKSPPHLAGQASAPLRGSLVNPCRRTPRGGLRLKETATYFESKRLFSRLWLTLISFKIKVNDIPCSVTSS